MMKVTGKTLIKWGYEPGPWFSQAIKAANEAIERREDPRAAINSVWESNKPPPALKMKESGHFTINIEGETEDELNNIKAVTQTMEELVRVPTIKSGTVMPDACPAGTIPVGGVVAAENALHPGFHSADICCSVALVNLGKVDPRKVMDKAMKVTHFGVGGRPANDRYEPSVQVLDAMQENKMLQWHIAPAIATFATQGDGNHFLYVGTMKSTGDTVVVTHHGSRTVGARLYKTGLQVAETFRKKIAPEIPKGAAWIPADTFEGETYWEALQIIKEWTRESHFKIHQLLGFPINDWFWNEHNFVFQKSDGFFYHAKGATPGWSDYDTTLVPLNMSQPILLTRGTGNKKSLEFLPHGAGRNFSRTEHLRRTDDTKKELRVLRESLDVRFFFDKPDISELPSAYKNADNVKKQISDFNLAEIVDEVIPYGSIMAGEQELPWKNRKKVEIREKRRTENSNLKKMVMKGFYDDNIS